MDPAEDGHGGDLARVGTDPLRRRSRKLDSTGCDLAEGRRSYKLVESEISSDPAADQSASQHRFAPHYCSRVFSLLRLLLQRPPTRDVDGCDKRAAAPNYQIRQ
jgi:hypothetical protein